VITTEHFTLQGARSSTTAEAVGRATMFLSAISGSLVALGLIATATQVGTAFYAFGRILLPTLAFIGLVTFERTLQSGVEDHGYARRIAQLRGYYFQVAPEITPYLLRVPGDPEHERLHVQGLQAGRWQGFRTVAGMGGRRNGRADRLGRRPARHGLVRPSLAAAIAAGSVTGIAVLVSMMRYQRQTWQRAERAPLFISNGQPPQARQG
jgi:hypothetical protein